MTYDCFRDTIINVYIFKTNINKGLCAAVFITLHSMPLRRIFLLFGASKPLLMPLLTGLCCAFESNTKHQQEFDGCRADALVVHFQRREVVIKLPNNIQNDFEQKKASSQTQICTTCAEGEYWLKLDPKEVFCPKISSLNNGKCSAYRRKK